MTWGIAAYGVGPFGGGGGVGPHLISALAISAHEVVVKLSSEPLHDAPTLTGDATNVATWTLQNLATTAIFTIIAAEMVTDTQVKLTVLEPLDSVRVTHRISTTTLVGVLGDPVVAPKTADFLGLLADKSGPMAARESKTRASRDLFNWQTRGVR